MKKKGFTLIELLAVIVILAIVALISTPIILDVIEKARKKAFEDSAYGVINAAKLYYTDVSLDGKIEGKTFTFPDDTKLKISGEKPKSGSVKLEESGEVAIAISNGKWCAIKNKEDNKVSIIDYSIDNCEIPTPIEPESCFLPSYESVESFDINYEGCMNYFSNENICTNQTSGELEWKTFKAFFSMPENIYMIPTFLSESVIENVIGKIDYKKIGAYACDEKNVKIPSKLNGYTIEVIEESAFAGKQLTSVEIQEGVKEIKTYAFINNQLMHVKIPNSVTSIGYGAFRINQISDIKIPDSVTYIGGEAFKENHLESVTIPNSITDIMHSVFENNQITKVEIPNSVTTIGHRSFNQNQLTNIKIGNAVVSIDQEAFANNQLTNVIIPSSVTSIGYGAFRNNQLANIEIPASVTYIVYNAFSENHPDMKIIVNKPKNSIEDSPWGASSVEWVG